VVRAVVSLGTNTTRLLVVRDEPNGAVEQLEHAQTGTRLGEGLRDGGAIRPEAMERTLAAVRAFVDIARGYDAQLGSIATSAVRRADNAAEFSARMRAITGVPLAVLDGATEARASFRGATYGAELAGKRVAVLDVGGGSTECAVGRDGRLEDALSIEIGSVRVSERRPALMGWHPLVAHPSVAPAAGVAAHEAAETAHEAAETAHEAAQAAREAAEAAHAAALAARAEIAERLAPFARFAPVDEVRCVAGTPLTIGAIAAGSHVDAVSGSMLSLATLDATIDRLLDLTLEERRALPGMLPQRADVLPGGALIVSEALKLLGATACRLEANDLLLGWLLMEREATAAKGES
jgi:exopolyphosphatase/guanosine-5'-triphosphate,3'-diphosphate pyrophosphatase